MKSMAEILAEDPMVMDIINRATELGNSTISKSQELSQGEYECSICKDLEWIIDPETNSAKPCVCREKKHYKRILEYSGISEAFQKKTLDNYIPKKEIQVLAKKTAREYIDNFGEEIEGKGNSIGFFGQVGSGKTHLSIAIANALMKKNIGVLYMQYREAIMKIKQVANDELAYTQEINKYKTAKVLLIDDLFKGATKNGYVNDADLRAVFEIINFRYLKNAPIIVSSEHGAKELLEFDEAIASRIIQMCKGRFIELKGQELNHRLFG